MIKLTQRDLDVIKIRVEKHLSLEGSTIGDVINLCDNVSYLAQEVQSLKDRVFDLEQSAPEEKRWENILANKLNYSLAKNKKDYLEITNSINDQVFIITIQKKFGKTPDQLRRQSEIRRLKAATKIVSLLKANKEMATKLSQQFREIQTLTTLRMPTPEIEAKTHEEIQYIIDKVNVLIKNYKKIVFPRQLAKLTGSMQESFREAWHRTSISYGKIASLEAQVKALKRALSDKRITSSRLGYRKREQCPKKLLKRLSRLRTKN
jgi:hypothetical protein